MESAITLEALKVLDAIERRGSYAGAAEELNKVPSALSYIVQTLEERIGVTLFTKQGRRSVLTPAGQHLLLEGRTILSQVTTLEARTQSIANGWESKIRIAVDSMYNTLDTFKIIETFLQAHPDIEVDVREELLNGSWEALINDEVDLLLGAEGPVPKHKGIHAAVIANLELVFAVSPNHPLARIHGPISQARLATERRVIVHDTSRSAIPWTRGITESNKRFYVSTIDSKIRAQLAGIGCGALPRQQIQQHLDSGELVMIEVEGLPKVNQREMYMAWKLVNHGLGLKALRESFLRHAQKHGLND